MFVDTLVILDDNVSLMTVETLGTIILLDELEISEARFGEGCIDIEKFQVMYKFQASRLHPNLTIGPQDFFGSVGISVIIYKSALYTLPF